MFRRIVLPLPLEARDVLRCKWLTSVLRPTVGSFLEFKGPRGVKLTTLYHLVTRLRTSGAVPPSLYAFMVSKGTTVHYMFSGFRCSVNEVFAVLGGHAALIGNLLPTSGTAYCLSFFLVCLTLERATDGLSRSFGNCQSTLRNIPENLNFT